MTAWVAIVVPLLFLVQFGYDFLILEYGSRFQLSVCAENGMHIVYLVMFTFAALVDMANFESWCRKHKKEE